MPMRHKVRFAAARVLGTAAAVLMMGGCATKGDIRDLRTELRDLAVRQDSVMAELRRETRTTQDTLRGQSTQLFDFRGSISQEIQDIGRSLSRIEALVGQNQQGLAGIRDQLANMRRSPVAAPPAADTTGGLIGGEANPSADSGAAPAQPQQAGGNAQSLFNTAVGEFNKGSLTTANAAFQQLLQSFPNNALAPDAQWYVANILEQRGDKKEALAAFEKIPQLYPDADKVPDAMYRAALLQIDLGEKTKAKATLNRLIATYPKAPIAENARETLKTLG